MDKKQEEKLLKTWAKKTGRPIKELREMLEMAREDAKKIGMENNDNVVLGIFGKKVRGRIYFETKGTTRREAVRFKGFLLGADRLRDLQDFRRQRCYREYSEDPEGAKLAGFVDEQGNPLDYRETIRNRRGEEVPNPNYHKPLIGHEYVRDVFGIAVKEGDTKPKLFKMTLWRGYASKFSYRPFVPITFKALIRSEDDYYQLDMSRQKDAVMQTIKEKIPIENWIREVLKNRFYKLEEIERAVQDCENATDPWILTEGTVDFIDTEVNPKTGSRSILLTDVENGFPDVVRIFIPKDFPLAFREYSKVLAFGRPRKWRRTEEDEYSYSINGISIYPIPGQTVEATIEMARPAEGEEEEEEGYNIFQG